MKTNNSVQQHISPQIQHSAQAQLPFSPKQPSALSQTTKFQYESTQQKTGQHAQRQKIREQSPNKVIENISDFELYNRNVKEEIGQLVEDEDRCQLSITYCSGDEKVYEIRINGLESKVIQEIIQVLDLEKIVD